MLPAIPTRTSTPTQFSRVPWVTARVGALLAAAVLLAYGNSLWGVFQFDDFNVIVDNPVVHAWAAWWADLGHGIRPLLKLSYTLNWTLSPGALGFHVFNLGVHIASTLLVYTLARLALEDNRWPVGRRTEAIPIVAALLFGLHPAMTEAVTYVSGRSSSLMTAFYLASVVTYVGARRSGRGALQATSLLLFALALATKETAVTLPFALLLWEAACGNRPHWREAARRQVPYWILLAAVVALWMGPVYGDRIVPDLDPHKAYRNLLSQIDAVGYLVGRLALVHPANIDPDLRSVAAWSPALAVKAAALAATLAMGLSALGRRPWWGFAVLWFFLQLAPTNSLLPRLDLANDRQLYLASVGPLLAIAIELQRLRERYARAHRLPAVAMACLLLALAGLSALRNLDYTDPVRLWEQTARVSPAKARVFNNLGFAYDAAGCFERAEAAYREALRLAPGYGVAQENLLALMHRWASAPPSACAALDPGSARDRAI